MRKETEGILKSLPAPPRPLCNPFQLTKIFGEESDDLIGLTVVERANHNGIRFEERHKRTRSNSKSLPIGRRISKSETKMLNPKL